MKMSLTTYLILPPFAERICCRCEGPQISPGCAEEDNGDAHV